MKVALLLHAHQPPTQFPNVLSAIVQRSYIPLLDALESGLTGTITLNITGSLVEQLIVTKEAHVLERITKLAKDGRVSLCGTGAYHPLLALLPIKERERQISIHRNILLHTFGGDVPINGFFIPELLYTDEVGEYLTQKDYQWIVLDESAFPGAGVIEEGQHSSLNTSNCLYKYPGSDMFIFFRKSYSLKNLKSIYLNTIYRLIL